MAAILVVDDTEVGRRLAGGLLEQSPGMQVSYAEDGNDALEQMQHSVPDLVVTDLQMPEMDGLELVTRIRMVHPGVPVVLITSKGSESVAIEALERGAASYVPKSRLSQSLRETVEELLSVVGADRTYAQLMACQNRIAFSYTLHNDVALIDALVDFIQQMVDVMELTDHTGKLRVGLAIREALLNAMFRGNLGLSAEEFPQVSERQLDGKQAELVRERLAQPPYSDRKIFVDARIDRDEALFVIRDEGDGFDHEPLMHSRDHSTLGSPDGKRGIVLMRAFLDKVSYNQTGNEVTLVKEREEM